jgi:hypothetical protein
MRRTLAILLSIPFVVPITFAQTRRDWDKVEKLKPRAMTLVLLWTGERLQGHVVRVCDDGLRLAVPVPGQPGASYIHNISRPEIQRVFLVKPGANPRYLIRRGAMLGAVVGLGVGIYRDKRDRYACGGGCWFVDSAGGALIGGMSGLIAAVVARAGDTAETVKLLYDNKTRPSPQS